jgi:hypothetical protein
MLTPWVTNRVSRTLRSHSSHHRIESGGNDFRLRVTSNGLELLDALVFQGKAVDMLRRAADSTTCACLAVFLPCQVWTVAAFAMRKGTGSLSNFRPNPILSSSMRLVSGWFVFQSGDGTVP